MLLRVFELKVLAIVLEKYKTTIKEHGGKQIETATIGEKRFG